jgi:hypothetical protein
MDGGAESCSCFYSLRALKSPTLVADWTAEKCNDTSELAMLYESLRPRRHVLHHCLYPLGR